MLLNKLVRDIFVIALFVFLSSALVNNVIAKEGDVLIKGNQRISESIIKSYAKRAIGSKRPDRSNMDLLLKKLLKSGLFLDAKVFLKNNSLVIEVEENPVVSEVKIVGNDKIDDDSLLNELSLKKRSVFSKFKLRSDLKRINDIYLKSGRYLANIEPKIVKKKGNRIEVIFDIQEGPKAKISKILFVGNEAFSFSDLKSEISTKESKWYKFFSSSDVYDSDRVDFDKEKLRKFYGSKGYADFSVVSAIAQISKNKDNFFIKFLLQEGIKYKINEVSIDNRIENFNHDSLQDIISIERGEIYNSTKIEKNIDEMLKAMSDESYAFADIDPVLIRNKSNKTIDLSFLIRPSSRIYVDSIIVKGNTRTRNNVILQELRIQAGDPYNNTKINRSKQRVRNLGFFDKVEIATKRIEDTDKVVLEVEVKERKTGELNLGLGYSTVDRASINIGLKERNLMGTGHELGVAVRKSRFGQSGSVSYTKPYFMDRPIRVGSDLYVQESDSRFSLAYDQKSKGATVRAGYLISEYLGHNINYSINDQTIENVDVNAPVSMQTLEGEFLTSSIGQVFNYDKRDNIRDTRKGYRISLGQDFAGVGGDIKYLKYTGSASFYQPLYNRDFILKLATNGGYIDGLGQDIRSNFGFFLGGNNFRGFEFAGLGPRTIDVNGSATGGNAVGGNMYYVATAEVRFPLGLPKELGIYGSLFSENGTVTSVDSITTSNSPIADTGSIRSSYGISISWQSPLGPIRFDFSKIAKQEEFDRTESFRFSFGTKF